MEPTSIASIAGSSFPSNMDMFNSMSSMATNFMNQRFSRQMYDRTRKDNIEFWHMQNAYNSPEQQMQRYKAAGLNPNLIYGQGNSGPAGSIPTPDFQPVGFREPRVSGNQANMSNLLMSADLRIKNAQADNLKVQNEVIRQDAYLRALQASKEGLNVDLLRETFGYQADAFRENLRKVKTDIDLSIRRDAREAAQNATSIQEAGERMLTMQSERTVVPYRREQISADTARSYEQIRQMIKDGRLKDLDTELRDLGIAPNSPMWAQIVGRFLSSPEAINRAAENARSYIPAVGKAVSPAYNVWQFLFSGQ